MRLEGEKNSTLYAFNDFLVSKPTYDFLVFVYLAELHRKRYGYKSISFVFLPGPKDGFRNDDLPPNDPDELRGMVRNIAIAGCWLLPACVGVNYLSSREEAKALMALCGDDVFPRKYTPDNPTRDYMWSGVNAAMLRGEQGSHFVAPKEFKDQAEAYVKLIAGDKKLITITLRESEYYPERNSRLNEWKKFIDYLDLSKYAVVIVRETKNAHSPALYEGVTECPLASINIGFRAALYQASYLTMQVSNGPASIAFLSEVPSLTFGWLSETHVASSAGFMKRFFGQTFGDQFYGFPTYQKLVWERDNFETIKSEFEAHIAHIEHHQDGDYGTHGFSSPIQVDNTCINVLSYVSTYMQRGVLDEDCETLKCIIDLMAENNADAYNLLGVYYTHKGMQLEAEQSFRNAISKDSKHKIAYMNLAATLQNKGTPLEAVPIYRHIMEAIESSTDVIQAAFNCAIAVNDLDAANELLLKSDGLQMTAETIEKLKSRLPKPS